MHIHQQIRALQALVEKLDEEINEIQEKEERYADWVEDLIKFIYETNGKDALRLLIKKIDTKDGKNDKLLAIWASDVLDEWVDDL